MRLVIARCSVDYVGRLTAHLPEALRLLIVKADGSVLVHSDGGSYKPLNWMSPPCRLTEEPGQWTVTGKSGETLIITLTEVVSDTSVDLGVDPGLVKDGVEAHLQELLAVQLGLLGSGFAWVYGLAAPLAGIVVDRAQRKTVILGGLHAWSVICLATVVSRNFTHLFLFRAAEGLGETFYFPASTSMLSDSQKVDPRKSFCTYLPFTRTRSLFDRRLLKPRIETFASPPVTKFIPVRAKRIAPAVKPPGRSASALTFALWRTSFLAYVHSGARSNGLSAVSRRKRCSFESSSRLRASA